MPALSLARIALSLAKDKSYFGKAISGIHI
jgi:hypothetical protein